MYRIAYVGEYREMIDHNDVDDDDACVGRDVDRRRYEREKA